MRCGVPHVSRVHLQATRSAIWAVSWQREHRRFSCAYRGDFIPERLLHAAGTGRWTAIDSASENVHIEVVGLVLASGADVKSSNNAGCASLHSASSNGQTEAIKIRLASETPLSIAGPCS